MPEDDIYARLDRVNGWRLDRQCAAMPSLASLRKANSSINSSGNSGSKAAGGASGGMLELSDILHQASKMQAQRLSNQDYTPRKQQRPPSPSKDEETLAPAPQTREAFLAGIARNLVHLRSEPQESHDEDIHPRDRMRRVVIVGASSGIGRSLALEYARHGAELLLCARRQDKLKDVADACTAISGKATLVVVGDITDRDTQIALRDKAESELESVDFLVLNAGVISVRPIADLWMKDANRQTADSVDKMLSRVMDVNVSAPAIVAGLFLPLLAKSRACVVVVASVASLVSAPTRSLYSASKHAVEGYFATFRMEVKRLGIDVTMVYPGTVDTELRLSAVDADPGVPMAGSKSGKQSPDKCAEHILRAAALRKRSLVTPWPYWVAVVVHRFAPEFIERLAMKKYNL
ncbi:hypothetical protein LPJ53_001347 [Coemansia erecta]|uniref:NAD(P)-binding protein n=1 Tax=Coemansia erecta TaxID=147472 RepID=A0A9W8CU76_9FUNG|nr:hypothetical protein LPJ53_001347 [Coemansia erecta]